MERNWRDSLFITLEREYVVSIHATITGTSAFLMNQYVFVLRTWSLSKMNIRIVTVVVVVVSAWGLPVRLKSSSTQPLLGHKCVLSQILFISYWFVRTQDRICMPLVDLRSKKWRLSLIRSSIFLLILFSSGQSIKLMFFWIWSVHSSHRKNKVCFDEWAFTHL